MSATTTETKKELATNDANALNEDVKSFTEEDEKELIAAVQSLSIDTVKEILAKGVSPTILVSHPDIPSVTNQTLLFTAIISYTHRLKTFFHFDIQLENLENSLLALLKLLQKAGVDINHQDSEGMTVLMELFFGQSAVNL